MVRRFIIRAVYGVMLLSAVILMSVFLSNREFAENDLPYWRETTASVLESWVTKETILHRKDENDERYYEYTVSYSCNASFDAWGGPFTFERVGRNKGETINYVIPEDAYIIPEPGSIFRVVYDPEKPGKYRVGSRESLIKAGEASFINLLLPVVFAGVAVVLIIIDIRGIITRLSKKELM